MTADFSPGLQRKAFTAENMLTTPLRHKECFKQMLSEPRIPITTDGKKSPRIRHWINEESIAEAFQYTQWLSTFTLHESGYKAQLFELPL